MAYKHGDGKKIDGRRVIVDVERGRTVSGWLPRRLGGGLGGTRNRAIRDESRSHSLSQDRERGPSSSGRGPFRDRSEADNRGRRHGSRDEANGGGRRDGGHREERGHRDRGERRDRDRGEGSSKKRSTRSRSGSRDRSSRRESRRGGEDVGGDRVSARDRLGGGGGGKRGDW